MKIFLEKPWNYLKEAIRVQFNYPGKLDLKDLIELYPDWIALQDPESSPLHDEIPWISIPAIKFIEGKINPSMTIFEYGSGGSTLFFARKAKSVISIEHDHGWFESVSGAMKNKGVNNCNYCLIEPEKFGISLSEEELYQKASDPVQYTSLSLINREYRGKNFKKYVSSIDQYPSSYFDFILIDGRSRPSCFMHAMNKVKKGGYIIWDNTDQKHYLSVVNSISKIEYRRSDFPGPTPYANCFTLTSLWERLI